MNRFTVDDDACVLYPCSNVCVPSEAAAVSTYTAVLKQDGDWWIGWEALEMNRAEARAAADSCYEELALAL